MPDLDQFPDDTINAFLPFLPVVEREQLVARRSRRNRRRDRHPLSSRTPGQRISRQQLIESLVSRLIEGPVPLPLLVTFARRFDFEGLPLLEHALQVSSAVRSTGRRSNSETEEDVDLTRISVESAFEDLFAALGEERPGQLEMAGTVMQALEKNRTAVIEAGTGTGKSLAYLVPSILFSGATGERVVISTHTRNLQDQLFRREMPLLSELLGIDVHAERLTGRENYLCSKKVISTVARMGEGEPAKALAVALSAALSARDTVEAISTLPDGVSVSSLTSPPRCPMNSCGYADHCPLVSARKRAREAKILFVNHALTMTDYRQGGAVLGPYSRIIFDEAHHLERCIMENLSVRVSYDDLERILEPVRPFSLGDDRWKLLLTELEATRIPGNRKEIIEKLSGSSKSLLETFGGIFRSIEAHLNANRGLKGTRTRYIDGEEAFAQERGLLTDFYNNINKLSELLKPIHEGDVSPASRSFQQEVTYVSDELSTLSEGLRFLAHSQDEDSVFWLEWGSDGSLRTICGSPLQVDRLFADYLEETCETAVFTSATLAEEGSFSYTAERLGLKLLRERPLELVAPSPFRYDDSCLILTATGFGDPNEARFSEDIGTIVGRLAERLGKRTMVLFTSYRLCLLTARLLEEQELQGPVLVQRYGESREALAERLRKSRSGILLGVASFWEGVDFPGEELEILVIPKLPFPVPTEPIVEARSEKLRAWGEDPFVKLFLPEAILRLRQGIGRLIRRVKDHGVVVILDGRLETRPYGKTILASLPSRPVRAGTADEVVAQSLAWFEARRGAP